jgi:integrase
MHDGAGRRYTRDDRYRALVLLAAFASLRWGEVTALHRQDFAPENATVRVRAAYTEQNNGTMVLGLPKSGAGVRTVNILRSLIPDLRVHLDNRPRTSRTPWSSETAPENDQGPTVQVPPLSAGGQRT